LVDVRSPNEFKTGHLAGAVNIPLEELESRVADLNSNQPLIMICQAGVRAEMASKLLGNCRDDIRVLQGGVNAWRQSGQELVMSVRTRWSLERQVRLCAGIIVLAGVGLGLTVDALWFGLAAVVGLGLTFAGLTDFCLLGVLLSKLPVKKNVALKPRIVSEVTDGETCLLRR
jgi:rhodanese-related sulfurtransferase